MGRYSWPPLARSKPCLVRQLASKLKPIRLWKMTSPLMVVKRPPFSGPTQLLEKVTHEVVLLEPAASSVPKPNIASACWAEARLGRRKSAEMAARKASFLKRNLL